MYTSEMEQQQDHSELKVSECDKSLSKSSWCTASYKQCAVSVIWENRNGWENRENIFSSRYRVIL